MPFCLSSFRLVARRVRSLKNILIASAKISYCVPGIIIAVNKLGAEYITKEYRPEAPRKDFVSAVRLI